MRQLEAPPTFHYFSRYSIVLLSSEYFKNGLSRDDMVARDAENTALGKAPVTSSSGLR